MSPIIVLFSICLIFQIAPDLRTWCRVGYGDGAFNILKEYNQVLRTRKTNTQLCQIGHSNGLLMAWRAGVLRRKCKFDHLSERKGSFGAQKRTNGAICNMCIAICVICKSKWNDALCRQNTRNSL